MKEDKLEIFRESLEATFKAILGNETKAAEKFSLTLTPSGQTNRENFTLNYNQKTGVIEMVLPENLKQNDIAIARGSLDALAIKIKYHSPAIHAEKEPANSFERQIFEAAEKARIEAIGAKEYKGVRENIKNKLELEWKHKSENRAREAADNFADSVELLIRQKITGEPFPVNSLKTIEGFAKLVQAKIDKDLGALEEKIYDQESFADQVRKIILNLKIMEQGAKDQEDKKQNESENKEKKTKEESGESESQEDAKAVALEKEGAEEGEMLSPKERRTLKKQQKMDLELKAKARDRLKNLLPFYEPYKYFTNVFDRIEPAEKLASQDELIRLRQSLDQKLAGMKNIINKLANRLQRKLLSTQARNWEWGLEEGIIDASRLSSRIVDPTFSHFYKWEKETDFNNTVVTLLIDNSGSMRGRPIMVAALTADIIAKTLERCRIKVEVLGFTTSEWKGGKSRKAWNSAASPHSPGRLNDLLHIIYKNADKPFSRARKNMGLMLKEGLLKENIDGEAIIWAAKRLAIRPEKRKILMVISDGAPVDDSTLSVMGGNYLDNHLKEVIETIENHSGIELAAIGIGHDVTSYYSRAVTIRDVEQLGDAMVNQFTDLFVPNSAKKLKKAS